MFAEPNLPQPSPALMDALAPGWQARAAHLEYAEERKEAGELPGRYKAGGAIAKVRYSHDAVIDSIIENPAISQNQLAAIFGYTPGWISQVMSSDAFKNRLETRKSEIVDPQIRLTLNERFNALVSRSLDVLQDKLMMPNPDPELALRAAALGAKALGLGNNAQVVAVVHNPSDRLEKLADRLTGLLRTKRDEVGEILDVQAHEVQVQGA